MAEMGKLIPLHGGYRKLKYFQAAELVYDFYGLTPDEIKIVEGAN